MLSKPSIGVEVMERLKGEYQAASVKDQARAAIPVMASRSETKNQEAGLETEEF